MTRCAGTTKKYMVAYGKPDCQASKSVAKHLIAVDADDGHH